MLDKECLLNEAIKGEYSPIEKTSLLAWAVCTLAACFYCYEFFLRVAPGVMVPDLMSAYHVTAKQIGILSAFYYMAYNPMQLPVGLLMDRYGARRLLLLATFTCAIASLMLGTIIDFTIAEISLFIMGFGSAFGFVGVLKLASEWLPKRYFALASGLAAATGMLGAIGGNVILMQLVDTISWQQAWLFAALLGVLLLIAIAVIVPNNAPSKTTQATAQDMPSWGTALHALLQLSKNPQFWLNGGIGCALFTPFTVLGTLWGVPYLTQAHHLSHSAAASAVSMLFLGMAIGCPVLCGLSSRIGQRRIILAASSMFAAFFSLQFLLLPSMTATSACTLLFLTGFSLGAEPLVFAIAHDMAPRYMAGSAVAGTNFIVMIGSICLQPIVGKLLDHYWQSGHTVNGIPVFSYENYQVALMALPLSLLISLVAVFFMPEDPGSRPR